MGVGYSEEVQYQYNMEGKILSNTVCEKDLGVYFDKSLNFDKHINTIINKANRNLGVIRRTFDYMDKSIFCHIFKGLIRPHLEYAAPVWSPYMVKHIEAIENVQRRATKMVPGLSNLEYPERLKLLKLPTLAYRRTRGDMITAFKIIKSGFDDSILEILPINDTGLRGHSKKLCLGSFNKDIRKHNFSIRVRKLWNKLPQNVIDSKDVKHFEIALDEFWSNQDLKYNHRAEIN